MPKYASIQTKGINIVDKSTPQPTHYLDYNLGIQTN